VPVSRPTPIAAPSTPPAPVRSPDSNGGVIRSRLHAALIEAKQTYVADALEHSELTESAQEWIFTTPKLYAMNLKHGDFAAIVQKVAGRPVKVTIKIGETQREAAPAAAQTDEVAARALEHPEVKRFQELFPDSQVRTVRNLKDG
jgi:hypothetical protein